MANREGRSGGSGKEKMLMLCSNNGEHFEVEESVAMESQTLKSMIEDGCANKGITLPNVSSKILAKVIEFCWKHIQARTANTEDGEVSSEPKKTFADELRTFNADFIKVDLGTLFELILAANYLDIKVLLDLTCQTVADMIKVKTPEEIRATFNIENDFTAEEEEQLRRDNQWAFE